MTAVFPQSIHSILIWHESDSTKSVSPNTFSHQFVATITSLPGNDI